MDWHVEVTLAAVAIAVVVVDRPVGALLWVAARSGGFCRMDCLSAEVYWSPRGGCAGAEVDASHMLHMPVLVRWVKARMTTSLPSAYESQIRPWCAHFLFILGIRLTMS